MIFTREMTKRTKDLYDELMNRAQDNRANEWFKNEMFGDFFLTDLTQYGLTGKVETKTILIRRAIAIDIMLKAMTDPINSATTKTAQINENDLLLGILPMGSNGLGKVFPNFLTADELRAGSITNRNMQSLFGHNTINYERLLKNGLKEIIAECNNKIQYFDNIEKELENKIGLLSAEEISDQDSNKSKEIYHNKTNKDFYVGIKIACQSVIDYAKRFANIAEDTSKLPNLSIERKEELLEMARIARKVPENKADNFHEAMQSITFFHIALHASMNFISLGRLDQVLNEFLLAEKDKNKVLEIMECFLIKLAGRLNLSSDYLYEQDHVDYATVLGTHSYYIDQKAGVNNFLQNIIIGGKTPEGKDATNEATYLILKAFENTNLSTPGIYVRLSKDSPKQLYQAIANCLFKTKNNPAIINDDVMIPAMYSALMQDDMVERNEDVNIDYEVKSQEMLKLANDFCIDGCWEPILNGASDWTFTMANLMIPLETSLNQGATLSPDSELFRGAKVAPYVPTPKSFIELMKNFENQVGFFTDQCALSMYLYYMIDEYASPSPLLSAYLKGCMERGRDKAWAGADYNLAGIIFGGAPTVVNTLLAIKKWVFDTGKYKLENVIDAFRFNFICNDITNRDLQNIYTSIQIDFDTNTLKFGDTADEVISITKGVLDICYNSVMKSSQFAKKIFQDKPESKDWKNIIALRRLTGYYGPTMNQKFDNFKMKFTVGLGTFEQYNWQGRGIVASADRKSGEPIAPNFSPAPGTSHEGAIGLIQTFQKLELNRFAGGVITDICLDSTDGIDMDYVQKILAMSIDNHMGMFTITIGSENLFKEIYEKVLAANHLSNKEVSKKLLAPYAGINVRIGGWQTPFITLPLSHMENYINRPVAKEGKKYE